MSAALRMALGVMVWAAHFAVVYGFTALACARGFASAAPWVVGAEPRKFHTYRCMPRPPATASRRTIRPVESVIVMNVCGASSSASAVSSCWVG